jgi:glycerol-3-phosphate dehydrogenase (NAD(P)+)
MENTQPFAILGAGSWGTALALHLSRLGQSIRLWTADTKHAQLLQQERANNRYLSKHPFPATLYPTAHLPTAVNGVRDILIAVPSVGFRNTLAQLQPLLQPAMRIVWATKGLDENTGQLLHEVIEEMLGQQRAYAVLAGPSFAKEVAGNQPTAVVIGSQDRVFAQNLLTRFNTLLFRVYLSTDVPGIEVGGAVKNVLAIATGISDGMGFGANARCALITRGLAEMTRFGTALGGQNETFTGLAGLGDLILTCTDDQSRNRRFGLALGKGTEAAIAEKEIGQTVEGKRNAEIIVQLANKKKIEMPIVEAVWQVLQGRLAPLQAMQDLLSRAPKSENK